MPIIKVMYQLAKAFKTVKQELPAPKPWTHKDKIRELQTDEYVSGEYLKGLITNSKKKWDLNAIRSYLNDEERTGNISKQELNGLWRRLNDKIDQLDMKELLRQARESGRISMSDVLDFFV